MPVLSALSKFCGLTRLAFEWIRAFLVQLQDSDHRDSRCAMRLSCYRDTQEVRLYSLAEGGCLRHLQSNQMVMLKEPSICVIASAPSTSTESKGVSVSVPVIRPCAREAAGLMLVV